MYPNDTDVTWDCSVYWLQITRKLDRLLSNLAVSYLNCLLKCFRLCGYGFVLQYRIYVTNTRSASSQCAPLPFLLGKRGQGGGRVEPRTKFSKWGALRGLQLWEGVAGKEGKEGGNFFPGGLQFYKINIMKSEIFDDKKSLWTYIFFPAPSFKR